MCRDDLDDLLKDEFLKSLDIVDSSVENKDITPSWVPTPADSAGRKAWNAIREIRGKKENAIKRYNYFSSKHTPKGLYKIKKSEVGRLAGKAAQNLFAGNAEFCAPLSEFLDKQNAELYALFEKEQKLSIGKQKKTGVRSKKKIQVVCEYQQTLNELNALKSQKAKDMLDLAISRLPLDLKEKLKAEL